MVDAIIICLQLLILFEVWHKKEKEKVEPKKEQSKADIFNKWMYGREPKRK